MAVVPFKKARSSTLSYGVSPRCPPETSLCVIEIDHPSGREVRRGREHKSCSMLRRLWSTAPCLTVGARKSNI